MRKKPVRTFDEAMEISCKLNSLEYDPKAGNDVARIKIDGKLHKLSLKDGRPQITAELEGSSARSLIAGQLRANSPVASIRVLKQSGLVPRRGEMETGVIKATRGEMETGVIKVTPSKSLHGISVFSAVPEPQIEVVAEKIKNSKKTGSGYGIKTVKQRKYGVKGKNQ